MSIQLYFREKPRNETFGVRLHYPTLKFDSQSVPWSKGKERSVYFYFPSEFYFDIGPKGYWTLNMFLLGFGLSFVRGK